MVCLTYGVHFYYWKNSNAINSVTFRGCIFILHDVYKVDEYHLCKFSGSATDLSLTYVATSLSVFMNIILFWIFGPMSQLCSWYKELLLLIHNFSFEQTEDREVWAECWGTGLSIRVISAILFPRWYSSNIISFIPFYRRGFQERRCLLLKCLKV